MLAALQNVARLLAAVPGYIYAQKGNQIFVNLYIGSNTSFSLGKQQVIIDQESNYPWDGKIKVKVNPSSKSNFVLSLRIPGWAQGNAMPSTLYSFLSKSSQIPSVALNGKPVSLNVEKGYVSISREWKKGDVIEINLPMPINRVVANEKIEDDKGKIALQRGPLVYCAEAQDNQGEISNLVVSDNVQFSEELKTDLLGGVVIIQGNVSALKISSDKNSVNTTWQNFIAIPYYSWANRGEGEMKIWLPRKIGSVKVEP
ncbi:MAG: glycoside hydrolase family 127 protein [Cyclobacteriaceae bacterium]